MPVLGGSTPLTSVNGKTGTAITLGAADVSAAPAVGNFGTFDLDVPVIGIHQEDPTEVIRAVLRRGFTPMWASELADAITGKRGFPAQPILLIFDDGPSAWSTTTHAAITTYKVKATMAVTSDYLYLGPPGTVDLTLPSMTWAQARTMHATGYYEWQNHTKTHAVNPSTFEMDQCNQAIQTELGVSKPVAVIYPHGTFDAPTLTRARALGFTIGFTYGPNDNRPARVAGNSEVLTIQRIVDLNEPLKWLRQSVIHEYENDMTGGVNDSNALGWWTLPPNASLGSNGRSVVIDSTVTANAVTATSTDLFAVKPGELIHSFCYVTSTGQTAGSGTVKIRQFDSTRSALTALTVSTVAAAQASTAVDVEAALSSSCRWVQLEITTDAAYNGTFTVDSWTVRLV